MATKNRLIDSLGMVSFVEYQNAKNIKIIVKPNQEIKVTMPKGCDISIAMDFVHSKIAEIKQIKEKYASKFPNPVIITENTRKITPYHDLIFFVEERENIIITLKENQIIISHSLDVKRNGEYMQETIKKAVNFALQKKAKQIIPSRLYQLAKDHNLQYKNVIISSATKKWGSCNSDNVIRISFHVLRLPSHLVDYVLLHELAHLKIKNHSHLFWEYLQKLLPDAMKLDAELNKLHQ